MCLHSPPGVQRLSADTAFCDNLATIVQRPELDNQVDSNWPDQTWSNQTVFRFNIPTRVLILHVVGSSEWGCPD